MNDTQSQTESLLDIIKGINNKTIMLPEFQRDFRWELDLTYDLFDSLIRDIFIGTLIYGKPKFAMTLREIDTRPRKGKGSSIKLATVDYSKEHIISQVETRNLRIVLDGQQRITAIYRAITGLDNVFLTLKDGLDSEAIKDLSLEAMMDRIGGEDTKQAISVKLSVPYELETKNYEDDDLNAEFGKTAYAQAQLGSMSDLDRKEAERIFRRAVRKLLELYKESKLVAFYLLDMGIEKFTAFFERSNSRGLQLDFTDILAAKLYHGFNLRKKIDEFDDETKFKPNREIIVRAIAYIVGSEGPGPVKIDKKTILEELDADDFNRHWDSVCKLYTDSLTYLANQNFILSQAWMPSENMVIPVMMFLRKLKGFDRMSETQREFIEYWYWASVFASRYSTASNETIIIDGRALEEVAAGHQVTALGYFSRMRPLVAEPDDLYGYTKTSSLIYRGVLNLLSYAAGGLKDWNNTQTINVTMQLEDHHIYPRAYIAKGPEMADLTRSEAERFVDCVVNRTLIPKLLNIQIGKKAPTIYLSELQKEQNPKLAECLPSHLIPVGLIHEETWDQLFGIFLDERAKAIFGLIEQYTTQRADDIVTRFGISGEATGDGVGNGRARLKDLIANGKVKVGDRVYTRKQPNKFASIVDGETVEYQGKRMLINSWGQQMTGWPTINIYESVLLERTGQPLKALRDA